MSKKSILTIILSAVMLFGVTAAVVACGKIPEGDSSQSDKTSAIVKFDLNIDGYETNVVKDKTVSVGKRVPIAKAYITGDNPDNLQLYGWYTDAACTDVWDFKNDCVAGDMTLYAKWVEQYNVNYYVNNELLKTEFAFNGDTLTEDATLVAGFKYLGTYLDADYENSYDYEQAVSGDLDLYIKRSQGIYMSDHVEEGELSSASLSDYLVAYLGTALPDENGKIVEEEGWAEPYTVSTAYASGTVEENCTYVNFGYSPKHGDGYVELCLALDITQSQTIRVWFKNLGKADTVNMYFTALLDAEKNIYSETGSVYTQDYCYPNYSGSGVDGGIPLEMDQINMDETSEWTYVDFNLHEVYTNGYSVWGTSSFLGMIRFQANYKNVNEEDWSNEFLIKAIEGIPQEIVVEDSDEIKKLMSDAENTAPDVLKAAGDAQAANPQGLVFPKDFASFKSCDDGVQVYNSVNGLIFYAENEIISREKGNPYYGFTLTVPDEKSIDMAELTTLNIRLRNYGYADSLTVRVYNDMGVPVTSKIKIASRMQETKTYTANLYGEFGMEGKLSKVEIRYNSVGVDNALLIENIQMSPFVPYDIVGLNFNDKSCFGIASTDQVEVSFDSNREGTLFNVSKSGASVTSADKPYKATTDGYSYATLRYYLYKDSNVSAVKVEYNIGGKFTSPYVYELDTAEKATVKTVTLPFVADERGFVQAVRLTFEGTGRVLVKSIDYSLNENSLPYYESYADVYKVEDWELNNTYQYDETLQSSIIVKDPTQNQLSLSIYIGISALKKEHFSIPHDTKNVLTTATTKIKIVYQNKTDVNTMNVIAGFAYDDIGNPDETGLFHNADKNIIDCNMAEYEWSTLTIEIPSKYADKYLGKIVVNFAGKEIAIRAISIETGV